MAEKITETEKDFSKELEEWLQTKSTKTFLGLDKVFGDRVFAILFMILMAASALPVPTAGLTDVFAVITILFALQMAFGKGEGLWLPKRWKNMKLGKTFQTKLLPTLIKFIRWLEKFSNPRAGWVFKGRISDVLIGLGVAVLAASTITAPPFSGLDTIPALGIVIVSAGIVLKDGVMTIVGFTIGSLGVGLQILLGKVIVEAVQKLF